MSDIDGKFNKPAHYTSAPVLFSDGVANMAVGSNVVKFYLMRVDPVPDASSGPVTSVSAQVVMPLDGFIATTLFFKERMDYYLESGIITQEQIQETIDAAEKPE